MSRDPESSTVLTSHSPQSKVMLDVIAGPHAGLQFSIDRPDSFLVGRGDQADLRLVDDPHFSRHHFLIKASPPECVLIDLGSRNATFVNGKRVQEVPLHDGDEISGGVTRIRVSISALATDDAPEPILRNEDLATPETVGSYELLRELGHGSMGVVYLARHRRTGREAALKVMSQHRESSHDALQLFLREASILSQLNHPRIVRFHEFGLTGPTLFLAMEYVSTVSLDDLMGAERSKRQMYVACGLCCQLLEALVHAHERGLVHRDIKPANVLVTQENRRVSLKLADFGLAKNYWNSGCSGVTDEGVTRGTLAYMAPEQVVNCRDTRPACDIYSTAATLYWMLTGNIPFPAKTPGQMMKAILESAPPRLSTIRPDLPGELESIVLRGLEKDPKNRFASAGEFRIALQRYSRKRPIQS
ncbi:MAG: FHA domain-containing serine/threonine-protein kinase [Planctomycetaceae bacterium]